MEVYGTDDFKDWYNSLDEKDVDAVVRYIEMLELVGFTLGFPYSSKIEEASFNLRELRVLSKGRPIRVFYAFDPERNVALLIGGHKSGVSRFYEKMINLSEKLWAEYLTERGLD